MFGLWPFLLTLLVPRLEAGTHVWAGGDYLWSKPGNWSSGGAPQVGEAAPVVIVLPPAGAKFSTNDIPGLKIDEIVITGNNYNLGVRNGAAFDFRGEVRGGNPMNGIYITNLTAKIHGPVVLTNQCRFMGEGSTLTINGAISGSGNFYLTGPVVEYAGPQANTFSGHTFVQRNELRLNKTNAVAIAGPIYIGLDHHNPDAVVVRHLRADQIANTADVTVYSDGLLDLNGHDDAVQDLVFYGGHVTTGAGTLFLGGNISALGSTDSAVIEGKLSVGIGQRVIHVEAGPPFDNLHIKAAVSGIAGVTKTGAGLLTVSGNNTYSSTVTITEGPVLAQGSAAFGSALGDTIVKTNGTLILFQASYAGETLDISGSGWQGLGAVHVPEGMNASWNGPVILSTDVTFMVLSNSQFQVNGVMSGPGGFELAGGGQMFLSGNTANTYAGTSRVHGSKLLLGKAAGVAVPGPLIVGGPVASNAPASLVECANHNQFHSNAPVSLIVHSKIDTKNFNQTMGPIEMVHGGEIDTGSGLLTLNGDIVVSLAPTNVIHRFDSSMAYGSRIRGRLNLGTQPRAFIVGDLEWDDSVHDFDGYLGIEADISGAPAVSWTKRGTGDLGLDGNNTYGGLSLVAQGYVLARTSTALGSGAVGTVVSNYADVLLGYNVIMTNEPLVMRGGGVTSYGFTPPGTVAWNGPVLIETFGYFSGDNLFVGGAISGPGKAIVFTSGNVRFTGATPNTHTGGTEVWAGPLELAKTGGVTAIPGALTIGNGEGAVSSADVVLFGNEQIANLAPVTIDADGGLDLNNFEESIGSLAGSGRVFCQTRTLTVGANDQDTVWSGGILGHGAETILKLGYGTLQITGDNYYSGQTVVQGGTLDVRGTLSGSQIVVFSTGKLIGTGTIGRLKNFNGGHTSPGAPVGTLTSGDVEMSITSIFRVDLTGLPPSGSSDTLNVTGTVNLGGATLIVAPSNALPVGANFTIINNDGVDAVAGMFNGLAEGAEFVANNQRFRISYAGGDGNDIVLTRANTAPSLTSITVATPANEGSLVGLDGTISDPDLTDTFTLVVNWGDGTPAQTINLPAGTTVFHLDHFYADDKPGAQPSDNFLIEYTLTDSAGSPAFGQLSTVIGNVPPSFPKFGSIRLKPDEALVTTLTFDDPGSDTWTATVNYGDGAGAQPLAVGPGKTLALSRTFPTNGLYTVALTVNDDDTGTGGGTLLVYVGYELTLTPSGPQQATLAWPGVFENAAPYRTTSVNSTNWTEVQGPRNLVGGEWKQVVSTTNAMEYFRLGESGSQ